MRLGVLTKALLAQSIALVLAVLLAAMLLPSDLPLPVMVILQAALAVLMARWLGSDPWWLVIHALFVPAAALVLASGIAPGWYLAAFVLLLLVFGPAVRSRVPLYLSTAPVMVLLSSIMDRYRPRKDGATPRRVLDFGSGTGSMVLGLASRCPDCQVDGIEAAWVPHLIARIRAYRIPNARLMQGDFWSVNLADYDLVYAFLSTEPMPALWEKASREMRDGTLLVSNSFSVPDVTPLETFEADDQRRSQLYVYRISR